MTPKPAYFVIRDLFQKVWHTEVEAVTNENGEVTFRGFFGEYDVEAGGRNAIVNALKKVSVTAEAVRNLTAKMR